MSGRHGTPGRTRMLVRSGRGTAVATTSMVLVGLAPFPALGRTDQLWEDWTVHNVASGLLLAVMLWFIVGAEPRNPVVWIVAVATGMSGLQLLIGGVVVSRRELGGLLGSPQRRASAGLDPSVAVLRWVNSWTWLLIAVPLATFLPLLFPDGHLPSPRSPGGAFPARQRRPATTAPVGRTRCGGVRPPDRRQPGPGCLLGAVQGHGPARQVAATFAGRLRDEVDLDEPGGDLRDVVAATVEPVHVSLGLRVPEASR